VLEASPGTGGQLLAGDIVAEPVQAHQMVLPGQLRGGQPDQQPTSPQPPVAGLDPADGAVEGVDHVEAFAQLGDRGHPRHCGQRPIRRADTHRRPCPLAPAHLAHQMGVLPASKVLPW